MNNECKHPCPICGLDLKPSPDPLYLESWRLAAEAVAVEAVKDYVDTMSVDKYRATLKDWQQWFYEKLKGGTDGK